MSDLVARLCEDRHPVELTLKPLPSIDTLRSCLDDGFVHVKFTETRGGTELGVRIDRAKSDLSQIDVASRDGILRIVGTLTLDYVPVECIAEIDLQTLKGTGQLVRV